MFVECVFVGITHFCLSQHSLLHLQFLASYDYPFSLFCTHFRLQILWASKILSRIAESDIIKQKYLSVPQVPNTHLENFSSLKIKSRNTCVLCFLF